MSLFPFLLFLLSILPYLPHYDKLQSYIFEVLMHNVFPAHMHADVTNYITTYRDWETDRKSTRLNSSHRSLSRMPSSA